MLNRRQNGFSVPELCIVIAIIALLIAVIFVVTSPKKREAQARDAMRQNDVQNILSAIKLYELDHDSSRLEVISNLSVGDVSMITFGDPISSCRAQQMACKTPVTTDGLCVNLFELFSGKYLYKIPVSPSKTQTWDEGNQDGAFGTGYTLERAQTGRLIIRACENEGVKEIFVTR